jgi:hypothetical protein
LVERSHPEPEPEPAGQGLEAACAAGARATLSAASTPTIAAKRPIDRRRKDGVRVAAKGTVTSDRHGRMLAGA